MNAYVAHLNVVLGVEVGGVALGFDALADGRAVAGIRGPSLAASLGVAVSP